MPRVNPGEVLQLPEQLERLARILRADPDDIERKLTQRAGKEFVWLRRRLNPDVAARIRALNIQGVFLQKEYRRFYLPKDLNSFRNISDLARLPTQTAHCFYISEVTKPKLRIWARAEPISGPGGANRSGFHGTFSVALQSARWDWKSFASASFKPVVSKK